MNGFRGTSASNASHDGGVSALICPCRPYGAYNRWTRSHPWSSRDHSSASYVRYSLAVIRVITAVVFLISHCDPHLHAPDLTNTGLDVSVAQAAMTYGS